VLQQSNINNGARLFFDPGLILAVQFYVDVGKRRQRRPDKLTCADT